MTPIERNIADRRITGESIESISEDLNMKQDAINRVLSKQIVREYRQHREHQRNSRINLSAGERVQRMLETVVESLERELDNCTTDDQRLRLAPKVADLSKLIDLPEHVADDDDRILLLPETADESEFNNSPTLGGSVSPDDPLSPIPPPNLPGGSKIPGRVCSTEKEVEEPEESMEERYLEIDEEMAEIYGEGFLEEE